MSPLESPPSDVPTRVCRRCSAQGQTNDLNCPHCGASYLRGFKGLKRGTRLALVVLPLLVLLAGTGGAAAMKVHHDKVAHHARDVAQARADAKRKAAAEATRRRAEAKRAQAAIDQIEIDARKSMEHEL